MVKNAVFVPFSTLYLSVCRTGFLQQYHAFPFNSVYFCTAAGRQASSGFRALIVESPCDIPLISASCLVDFLLDTHIFEYLEEYGITGERIHWRHKTMTSEEAIKAMFEISGNVSSSCLFPGGEYFTGIFISLGYSTDDVQQFFSAIRQGEDSDMTIKMMGDAFGYLTLDDAHTFGEEQYQG